MYGFTFYFNESIVHSYDTMHLILQEKNITKPEAQTYYVDVPGRNGLIDLTEGLTGRTCFKNGKVSLTFALLGKSKDNQDTINYLNNMHGNIIKAVDDDYEGYYYKGRCSVSINNQPSYQIISIEIDTDPFMYALNETTESFTLSSTERSETIQNDGTYTIPTIEVSGSVKIVTSDTTLNLSSGLFTLDALELANGTNTFTISGSGTLVFKYTEMRYYYV